jgi:hypothetical protein
MGRGMTKLPLAGKQQYPLSHRATHSRPTRTRAHVPPAADSRPPRNAGPHVSAWAGMARALKRIREVCKYPGSHPTVRMVRSNDWTAHNAPHRQNGWPGFPKHWHYCPTEPIHAPIGSGLGHPHVVIMCISRSSIREHPKSSCALLKHGKPNCACTIFLAPEPRVVHLDGHHNIQK